MQGRVGDGPAGEQPPAPDAALVDVVDQVAQQLRDRRRDRAGRVTEAQVQLAVDVEQVVAGEPMETAEQLGVEQRQHGHRQGGRHGGVVGEVAAQQHEAALLDKRDAGRERDPGRVEVPWQVAVLGGREYEAAHQLTLMDPVGGVSGVDVALGDRGGIDAVLMQPGQERLGLG
jgi:hypothetical protein